MERAETCSGCGPACKSQLFVTQAFNISVYPLLFMEAFLPFLTDCSFWGEPLPHNLTSSFLTSWTSAALSHFI